MCEAEFCKGQIAIGLDKNGVFFMKMTSKDIGDKL